MTAASKASCTRFPPPITPGPHQGFALNPSLGFWRHGEESQAGATMLATAEHVGFSLEPDADYSRPVIESPRSVWRLHLVRERRSRGPWFSDLPARAA